MDLLITCTPGLEEVVLKELREKFGKEEVVVVHKGLLLVKKCKERDVALLNYWGKTFHRVIILLRLCRAETLEDIYRVAREISYAGFLSPEKTFAVKAKREGEHRFTSIDIAATVGRAVIDSFLQEKGKRLKVNLSNPDVRILCELRNTTFWIGVDTTGESLHKRWYRKGYYITSLRSTIAHSMLYLLGDFSELYDPLCGSGMIPIEAFHFKTNKPNKYRSFMLAEVDEKVKSFMKEKDEAECLIVGSDRNKEAVKIARKNSLEAEAKGVKFFVADAFKVKFPCKMVCTDMPYGIRMRRINLRKFYSKFFKKLEEEEVEKCVFITSNKCSRFVPRSVVEREIDVIYGDVRAVIFLVQIER